MAIVEPDPSRLPEDLKPGDELLYISTLRRSTSRTPIDTVIVDKVAKKWATGHTARYNETVKFDMVTGYAHRPGYAPNARVATQAMLDDEDLRDEQISQLRHKGVSITGRLSTDAMGKILDIVTAEVDQ